MVKSFAPHSPQVNVIPETMCRKVRRTGCLKLQKLSNSLLRRRTAKLLPILQMRKGCFHRAECSRFASKHHGTNEASWMHMGSGAQGRVALVRCSRTTAQRDGPRYMVEGDGVEPAHASGIVIAGKGFEKQRTQSIPQNLAGSTTMLQGATTDRGALPACYEDPRTIGQQRLRRYWVCVTQTSRPTKLGAFLVKPCGATSKRYVVMRHAQAAQASGSATAAGNAFHTQRQCTIHAIHTFFRSVFEWEHSSRKERSAG
jgi:hypothetical protein